MPIVLNGTSGITTDGLTTGGLTYSGSTAPGLFQDENRIINGAFDFWQRGASQTTNGYGSADRWQNSVNGGTVTMSRQSFTVGDTLGSNSPTFFMRHSVSGQSLAAHCGIVTQSIEGVRSYAGQTITILGWARRSSGAGNMVVEGVQYFGTGGTPSATVNAISPTTVTLSASWSPFAVVMSFPSIAGKTIGSNSNDSCAINFWTSAGSDFNARTNSLGLQTIGVDLWGIHIRVGTHTADATSLYRQPELGPELARCQRYYQGGSCAGVSYESSSTNVQRFWCPYTQKRTVPSVTLTKSAGSAANPTSSGGIYTTGVFVAFSSTASSQTLYVDYTADAEL